MRPPCMLMQATSHLHPERPEHPDAGYVPWLHPVLGHHPASLPQHPDRFNNTTSPGIQSPTKSPLWKSISLP